MTKYVFIGDIHGKVEMVEKALAMDGRKVFVGDFIDSWDRSVEDHARCYDLVLAAIAAGEAEATFGNHELSYLIPKHRCSGHNAARKVVMAHYAKRILAAFKPYILLAPDFLVSHAGLTGYLWERGLETLPQTLEDWWPDLTSPMHYIGKRRGGFDPCGGLFWCDWVEFKPVPGLTQIFGHTRGKEIRQEGTNWCIDCLDYANDFLVKEFD